jgi:hypothetical protein
MLHIEITGFKKIEEQAQLKEVLNRITPLPQEVESLNSSLVFNKNISFYFKGKESEEYIHIKGEQSYPMKLYSKNWTNQTFIARIFQLLNQRLTDLGIDFVFTDNMVKFSDLDYEAAISRTKIPDDKHYEAYRIEINEDQLIIDTWTYRGLFYAFITLSQLMVSNSNNKSEILVPALNIWDYPDYGIRGLVDDISRGQRPTIENFKKFIRHLSMTKQNVLVLYIEDIFKYECHPEIGEGRGPLTKADIYELEEYAKEWFVEIQPAVEMFGHMENILSNPKFMDLAEFPGAQVFDVSNPKAKEFAKELLEEICKAFQSEAFHLICDESFDYGLRKSKQYVKEKGWAEAITEWYLFLRDVVVNTGKTFPTIAHDVIQKSKKALQLIKGKIPLILYWDYSDKNKYPKIDYLKKEGFAVAGSPAVFDWSRHYPYYDYAEINMLEMGRDGLKRGLVGLVTTKWGDFFNENFRENIYYGLSANGQAAWTANQSKISQIRDAFAYHFYGTTDPSIIQCMDTLSKQNKELPSFPNGMFNRYWLDPFCREIKDKELNFAERIIKEGLYVRSTIQKLRAEKIITLNADNLDFMDFSARMAIHYGAKLLISESIYRENPNLAETARNILKFSENQEQVELKGFKWLKQDIEDQRKIYNQLWKRQAVPQGLEYPDKRFEWLAWYYENAIRALENGQKPGMSQLNSEWIWRSGLRYYFDWANAQPFYFYKGFNISDALEKKKIKKALVQGIAANYMKIYLNSEVVGEVYSRMSLSQLPEAKSVQMFDVTSKIKESNIICVEAINWAHGIGSFNLILHIDYDDGSFTEIKSDRSWKWSEIKVPVWPFKTQEDAKKYSFKRVRSFGKPPGAWQGPISAPRWDVGEKSSVSFVIGARNFIETAIPMQVGEKIFKPLFWAVPLGIKILKVDCVGYRKNE